ncbi:lipid-A-disaccharide synthase [Synechocystis sp. PCC 7339]|uniref:lipid-A-disaccharide synthase n=1 Tax=unclassified Synechocystis TaxID=2640012 RepID=UPI001BB06222|nr:MULTISPECIES: lipid-A-disaccharide synthase [unclassified Synechocystis]QUS61978.1 lipid-A-disaccharide synthase [Synechocystis sp. PCC 7338]UAJ74174.1 lipid-A-disaccharide synthase [Synechocystis sp. PCC 7339]
MRIFISTGEVSGDLQGSLLVTALKQQAQKKNLDLELVGLGGEKMAAAGMTLLANTAAIGSVGLTESLRFIIPTWRIQQRVKKYLKTNPVDLLVLIDYMGPNLTIANYLRKTYPDLPILYYIAPQAWVWSPTKRETTQIMAVTDRLLAIFPGEAEFFRNQGLDVTWVGHPLLDRITKEAPSREEARKKLGIDQNQTVITLLPASRIQELRYLLPPICGAAQQLQSQLPNVKLLLPVSLRDYQTQIEQTLKEFDLRVQLLDGKETLTAIACADLAITKSGTVNLEIALLNVPQVILYRVSPLTMTIARRIFKFDLPFVSPTNIVLQRAIMPELLQEQATASNITQAGLELLFNGDRRATIAQDYQALREALGEPGVCERAAQAVLEFVRGRQKSRA